MMLNVDDWLHGLGLAQYADLFRANDIEGELLGRLTGDDLRELGVASLGHRKRLLEAIAALTATPGQLPPLPRREAERRQLTVMFVDLVGSTALSARLDPEAMSEVLRGYQNAVAGEISRFEGHVAKLMGDGVLAYFGWPRAHEDDAERSVRSGLALVAAVARLTGGEEALACRVGIATGLVVVGELVGEGAAQEQAVVGDTPNLAARLQSAAEPGQVVVADGTRRLLGDLFVLGVLCPQTLKGIAGQVPAFSVLGERTLESRFAARQASGVAPLVGRDQELALLVERWRMARAGEGQLVLLIGEAGIGKSRLTRALIDALAGEPLLHITQQASPYHTDSALHPTIRQLAHAAGFAPDDPAEARLDKLEALLGRAVDDSRAAAPLIAALLELDGAARYGPLGLSPQQQRARTLQALQDQVLGLARQRPVLLLIEDAHWIDPTSLELLELLLERIGTAAVLVLVTARPGFQAPFRGHPIVTRLALNRLGREATAAIVARITGGRSLPEAVLAEIAARTDGVPLFVEELTKTIVESGMLRATADAFLLDAPLHALAIPSSLHDSLMARLDRVLPVKQVAQTAAVIGREFDHALLAVVAPLPEVELLAALDHLVEAELIFRRGTPPDARYLFKHALVRDAAYESLLKSRRQALHGAIARAIEEHFPDVAQAQPELLARHFAAAGLPSEAIACWQAAAGLALTRSANSEAVAHLRAAIRLLPDLPGDEHHEELETDLQLALGGAAIDAKGLASSEVETAYRRSRRLARKVGDARREFTALWGLWRVQFARAGAHKAGKLADGLLRLAERQHDPELLLEGLHAGWGTAWYRGDLITARRHVERGRMLYDRQQHAKLGLLYGGHDVGACSLATGGIVHWTLGHADQARERNLQAYALATELGITHTLAHTWCWATILPQLLGDADTVQRRARDLHAIATEHGLSNYLGQADIYLGWVEARAGASTEGVAAMRRGLASLENAAGGAEYYRSYFRSLVADGHARAGRPAEALAEIGAALAEAERAGEGWYQAELVRRRGELLALLGDEHEAQLCLEEAIEIAKSQYARAWELRAAVSLGRLWAESGRKDKAADLLAPIYGWFTEGFDTPDLIEAQALLAELAT
jgi:class 3 adenylate cyclase/tetratricopeptide (TPR) repeat protein/ABC-type transport system involved in cytochrome c biogenesis ATPase subunit